VSKDSTNTDIESIHYAGLTEVAALIKCGDLSPVELTQRMLNRITTVDANLHSYITVMAEQALAAAQRAEQDIAAGNYRGALHGIPVAVKDLAYTRNAATTGGHSFMSNFVPDYDATVVTRLAGAGTVLLGKLNLTEGALIGYHRDFHIPVNPWHADYWPGLSSSGPGVATAAGLCYASLGTDTGGSIRFPALANGIVGLKPTYGRVSRYGILPLAPSLDHVGPMTRRVADAALVLEAIAGYDANDPTSLQAPIPNMRDELQKGVAGLRIGFDRLYATHNMSTTLSTAIQTALIELERLGARIVEVEMPDFPDAMVEAWFALCAYEAQAAHRANYPSRAEHYGEYLREFLAMGAAVTDQQYVDASRLRADFNDRLRGVLANVDAIATPAGGAPFIASRDVPYGGMGASDPVMASIRPRFTFPADLAGTPALALPCGVSEDGLPLTMQLMGKHLSEPMLCRIGHAYEQATEWHTRHPAV